MIETLKVVGSEVQGRLPHLRGLVKVIFIPQVSCATLLRARHCNTAMQYIQLTLVLYSIGRLSRSANGTPQLASGWQATRRLQIHLQSRRLLLFQESRRFGSRCLHRRLRFQHQGY
jgi:hypothetical protein